MNAIANDAFCLSQTDLILIDGLAKQLTFPGFILTQIRGIKLTPKAILRHSSMPAPDAMLLLWRTADVQKADKDAIGHLHKTRSTLQSIVAGLILLIF